MVLSGIFFVLTRVAQLIFLIPIIGMLSYFVNGYTHANFLTPTFILVLFIVSVLAGVWALATLLFYAIAKHNGYLLAFVDICIFGGLIAGVVELAPITNQSCGNFNTASPLYVQLYVFDYSISKTCNMLKACFALAIIEILMFFWSALVGLWIHHHHRGDVERKRTTVEKHSSRHSHRRRNRSRSRSAANQEYRGDESRRGTSRPPPRSNYGGSRR